MLASPAAAARGKKNNLGRRRRRALLRMPRSLGKRVALRLSERFKVRADRYDVEHTVEQAALRPGWRWKAGKGKWAYRS